jgi:hypothetical protein
MFEKVMGMYGNTQIRIAEMKTQNKAGAPKPATPAPIARLTPEETIQTVADLDDPAKAGDAMVRLVADVTGIDLKAEAEAKRKKDAADTETARMQGVVAAFLAANPDYYGTKRNGVLLRDRALAIALPGLVEEQHFTQAYEELEEMGVFEAPPPPQQQTQGEAATPTGEPSAQPAVTPRAGTGLPPSSYRGANRASAGRPKMTIAEIEAIAGTEEYAARLRDEPGFSDMVNRVLDQG